MENCSYCGTSVKEIKETGFVGCAQCYLMPEVRALVQRAYGQKKHKGRGGKNGSL